MFGKKSEQEQVAKVPVFTIESLPRPFEPMKTIHTVIKWTSFDPYPAALEKLGEFGAAAGADAVIGVRFHTPTGTSVQNLYAFGTAIRYLDKEQTPGV